MKKTVKKTARKEPSIREDIRRLGVMVEAKNDQWDLVAEQYGDIKKTLDGHTQTFEMHTEMFGKVFIDLSLTKEVLDQHTETLATHTEIIGKLAVNVEIIKEDIEFIKTDLKKKVDIDQFAALEKRVAFLERKVI